ncbi:CbrC family protein [Vibrio gallaecicus]|uniref:CbrC family protein n=1 Tax=Vibrio gallaecicus TaxID=552386 RepID=UPI0010C935D2|nr:CbrC family protein [Vibrio gallaecicus]MDN3617331.1 CbrC family protein [Vibrio gallaecicus]
MKLPIFKYHPDPLATGSIEVSDEVCECCEKTTGYIYSSTLYAQEEVEFICPWCIADGLASKKFDGTYIDDYPLISAGLGKSVVSEVCERTPGYNSWQQEQWQSHCNDACEFHGDAEKEELQALSGEALDSFLEKEMIKLDIWVSILAGYQKGGSPAVYKFKCRKCPEVLYTMDFD